MSEPEFRAWPKTPRYFRDITITEKIDGTNAAIGITFEDDDSGVTVYAQSRKRIITPADDNYGFATWVEQNKATLAYDLGPGLHFGEWWGQGIQRNYGLDHRRFSLFNTGKWADKVFTTPNLYSVPVLEQWEHNTTIVADAMGDLENHGSRAAPGFMNPEGVVIFHHASRQVFKATLDGDGHKG